MSRHQRLQRTMRNPQRAARRAGKPRQDARKREYLQFRRPEAELKSWFAGRS